MTHCHGKYFSLENIWILVLVENSLSLPHPKKLNSMLRVTLFFYAQRLLNEETFSFNFFLVLVSIKRRLYNHIAASMLLKLLFYDLYYGDTILHSVTSSHQSNDYQQCYFRFYSNSSQLSFSSFYHFVARSVLTCTQQTTWFPRKLVIHPTRFYIVQTSVHSVMFSVFFMLPQKPWCTEPPTFQGWLLPF